ncbi:MAG TPA: TIGR04290 family methyltransferase [Bryobacteraceae bacterium]|nr:TIGR04290 family methyltransferase [Bryobacteraceae bacterium]
MSASESALLSRAEIERQVKELGSWFHNLNLLGVQTAPEHFLGDYPSTKWSAFKHAVPADLSGKSVLDIGCNGGFYSIEMKRRGAERVVAIDSDEKYLKQARFAASVNQMDIEFRNMSVYEVPHLRERFDLVIFMGVLYHLRHPLLALDMLYEHVTKDLLLFQSMQRGSQEVASLEKNYPFSETAIFDRDDYPRMHFVEHEYSNDWTNWWIPNRACVEAMLRSSGFDMIDHPEEEVYVCKRRESRTWEALLG